MSNWLWGSCWCIFRWYHLKTNKYKFICAPFTCFNLCMNNVMFGLNFMSNKTKTYFQCYLVFLLSPWGANNLKLFSQINVRQLWMCCNCISRTTPSIMSMASNTMLHHILVVRIIICNLRICSTWVWNYVNLKKSLRIYGVKLLLLIIFMTFMVK